MNRHRVTVPWGCHPAFLVAFDVTLNLYPDDGLTPIPETLIRAVFRLKPDGTPDHSLVTVDAFERVMGRAVIEDLCDAALEMAKDAQQTADACVAIMGDSAAVAAALGLAVSP